MKIALWDTETNGLWPYVQGKSLATKMHCVAVKVGEQWYSGSSQFLWASRGTCDVVLPSGKVLKNVIHCTNEDALKVVAEAELRVAHNGDAYDDRVTSHLYPWWKPSGASVDTMHLSRLLFPTISKEGPNTHKVPPQMRTRHSVEAWGYRLNVWKDKGFDPGDWQTWSPEMQLYMLQDVDTLEAIFKFLMSQKPAQRAMEIEHGFARIIRRQEQWGFTVDFGKLLALQAKLETQKADLERQLIDTFGEWWEPGKVTTVKASRKVKCPEWPNITTPRYNASGKRLPRDYVGPPLCYYDEGAKYTPIERVEFSPSSREHVRKMLQLRYGWKPTKFNKDTGSIVVDDDVLRALDYPEAPLLADYYTALKVSGYVSTGANAWIKLAVEQGSEHRMFGQVMTIGTYTFRCAHMKPNMGQIPSRNPEYGHLCRDLFTARKGFKLVGFDGSGMQLRLLAHYMARYDGGRFAQIVAEGDPHSFMRDICQQGLLDAGEVLLAEDKDDPGRGKGKTTNYAIVFGGGDKKLGSIWRPHATQAQQTRIGKFIREAMTERLTGLAELNADLKDVVLTRGYITGLDGRTAKVLKPHAALATLLQMGEAVVMKLALIIMDKSLQAEGLRPGVDFSGVAHPDEADYEFTANVHDEAQADVREDVLPIYERLALQAVTQAGIDLKVKCPLKSDVKVGDSWSHTH